MVAPVDLLALRASSALERLIGENRIVPARLDLFALGLPPEQHGEVTISEALAAQRGER
jgi:hypothetical protein